MYSPLTATLEVGAVERIIQWRRLLHCLGMPASSWEVGLRQILAQWDKFGQCL